MIPLAVLALSIAGCEGPTPPTAQDAPTASGIVQTEDLRGRALTPFVAIGVSIEEGRQSNGTVHTSQEQAWPAQLAQHLQIPFTQPLIADPGCPPAVVAPLISGALAGEDGCAPNLPGVDLPANDLGVTNATTHDALFTTPEIAASEGAFRGLRYSRILPSGQTQLSAMVAQHPRLVAVDLGGAEILPPLFGDVTEVVPFDEWRQDYDGVIARVKRTGARAVLVWFTSDLALLSGERRGWELYADRAEFAAEHIAVPVECNTTGRHNLINIADFLFQLVDARVNDAPPPVLSCTDVPGTEDDVLTPADLAVFRADANRRREHIERLARHNGYAFFSIDDALHNRPDFKPRFSFSELIRSSHPYGPLMSLDELHPNARGHALLAKAAAQALAEAYHLDLDGLESR